MCPATDKKSIINIGGQLFIYIYLSFKLRDKLYVPYGHIYAT